MSTNDVEEVDEETSKERARTFLLFRLQWLLNIVVAVLSAIAIGLAYAEQRTLAQIIFLFIALIFIGSVILTVYRYRRNSERRQIILDKLDAERNTRLREVFDEARREKRLPNDRESKDGFDNSLREISELAEAERLRKAKRNTPKEGGKSGR
jgi:ABC-type multidrug transport system fused ATPase/permease subunit